MINKRLFIPIGIFSLLALISCSYSFVTGAEIEKLCQDVYNEIEYVYEAPGVDYFQSPTETAELGTGDCEDFSIYFMYLAKKEFGIKLDFVVVGIEGFGYHAITYYDGGYYDPTNNLVFSELREGWHEIVNFSYDIIMLYATAMGTKGMVL